MTKTPLMFGSWKITSLSCDIATQYTSISATKYLDNSSYDKSMSFRVAMDGVFGDILKDFIEQLALLEYGDNQTLRTTKVREWFSENNHLLVYSLLT